ncbi:hypothetical protein AL522_22715 [Pantoea vagans]|nr:hypothetical protein AL522_22715 [Pantoea vagans]
MSACLTCYVAPRQCSPSSRTSVRSGGCVLAGRNVAATPTAWIAKRQNPFHPDYCPSRWIDSWL